VASPVSTGRLRGPHRSGISQIDKIVSARAFLQALTLGSLDLPGQAATDALRAVALPASEAADRLARLPASPAADRAMTRGIKTIADISGMLDFPYGLLGLPSGGACAADGIQ
jgi:hypothetical protein